MYIGYKHVNTNIIVGFNRKHSHLYGVIAVIAGIYFSSKTVKGSGMETLLDKSVIAGDRKGNTALHTYRTVGHRIVLYNYMSVQKLYSRLSTSMVLYIIYFQI